ncbi:hypothetical protein ZWY2020_047102 [Hordeum vulgare]|nr:hypothetical protein ZWY2020_047102 [Hordeum vulgare]
MLSLSPLHGSMCGTPHPHSRFITFKRINMHSPTSLVPRDIPKPASADELAKNGKKKKSLMSNIFRKKGRSGADAGTSDKRPPSCRDRDFLFGACVAVIVFDGHRSPLFLTGARFPCHGRSNLKSSVKIQITYGFIFWPTML